MSILDLLDMAIPEEHAERLSRWEASFDAGFAGCQCPQDGFEKAFAIGVTKRRAAAGEIVAFVCRSCKCNLCGAQNYEWRLGCACWTEGGQCRADGSMTYGFQVEPGSDPDAPTSEFMTYDRMKQLAKLGREILDWDGQPITFKD